MLSHPAAHAVMAVCTPTRHSRGAARAVGSGGCGWAVAVVDGRRRIWMGDDKSGSQVSLGIRVWL